LLVINILGPLLIIAFGATFIGFGVGQIRGRRRFEREAVRTQGVIAEFRRESRRKGGRLLFPVIAYQDDEGQEHRAEVRVGRSGLLNQYQEGQSVEILYSPTDPTRIAIEGDAAGTVLATIFMVFGGGAILVGLLWTGIVALTVFLSSSA